MENNEVSVEDVQEMASEELKPSKLKRWGMVAVDIALFVVFFIVLSMLIALPFQNLFLHAQSPDGAASMPINILNETLMLVSGFLSVWLVLFIRKQPLTGLGFALKGYGKDFLAGLLFAIVLYGIGFSVCVGTGAVEVTDASFSLPMQLQSLVLFLLVAIFEEMVSRGFILGRMLDGGVNKFWALFFSALLFSLMHLFNPNFAFVPFLNILLAGMLLGASYIYTRNLCFPIALHWFWNWLQGPVLGFEVSGVKFSDSLLSLHLPEDNQINGGSFGFEGSLLCTVLMVISIFLIIKKKETKMSS